MASAAIVNENSQANPPNTNINADEDIELGDWDVASSQPDNPSTGPELKELSLLGIRSFAPDGIGTEQKLKFSKPLTLILGPNGAGKTTIIEALRFLCSAEIPPGQNYAFSYDINLAKEKFGLTAVRSIARLRFRDVCGVEHTVHRERSVLLKMGKNQPVRGKPESRLADSTIETIGADGKVTTCTSRTVDITKEIEAYLCVSKAVINNVLFCHQEDSSWPLSEGKVLKEKFDAIFSIERYKNALESIRESKKHFSDEAKQLLKEEEKGKRLAEEAERELKSLKENKTLKGELETKIATTKVEIEQLQKEVASADGELQRALSASHALKSVSLRVSQVQNTIEQLTYNVPKEYKGADEELGKMLCQQTRTKEDRERSVSEAKLRETNAETLLRRLRNEEIELNKEIGARRAQEKQYKEMVQDRLNFALQLEAPEQDRFYSQDVTVREQNFDNLSSWFSNNETDVQRKLREMKAVFKEQVLAQRQKLTALEGKRAQQEAELIRCDDRIEHLTQELLKVEHELGETKQGASERVPLESEVSRQCAQIGDYEKNLNETELTAQLGQLKSHRKDLHERKQRCEERLKSLLEMHHVSRIVPSYEGKEEELKCLREEENVTNDEVEQLQKRMNEKGVQLRLMQTDLSRTQNKLITLQLHEIQKAHEQKETIKKNLERHMAEHVPLRTLAEEHLQTLSNEIAQENELLNQFEQHFESEIAEYQRQVQRLANSVSKLAEYNTKIRNYVNFVGEDAVLRHEGQLQGKQIELCQCENDVQQCRQEVETRSSELKNEDSARRFLQDNLNLRQKRSELEMLRIEEQQLKDILGDFKINEVQDLRESNNKRLQELLTVVATNSGRMEELQRSVNRGEEKLQGDIYANARREYIEIYCERIIAQRSIKDCELMYKAVDKAILSYHGAKMVEINESICELWTSVYRGNDIDFIEIQHDVDAEAQNQGISGNRRTYNYRVVMVKSGVSLDMRSRCSAGQKVLACLIIRLALAEVFCTKCGIMALDEPTTNLDHENSMKLAEALSDLVKSRQASGMRNSQLIVITHDEDFLRELNRERHVTSYYKVDRDTEGRSTLESKPFYI